MAATKDVVNAVTPEIVTPHQARGVSREIALYEKGGLDALIEVRDMLFGADQ